MLVDIDKIVVGDRIRRDFGDLEELAENIRRNGLLNPLTVNSDFKLLAGERRYRACKLLGWQQVDVRMVESEDEAQDLEIEMSENNVRRNFTGSELAEGLRRQMAIETEKARQRMVDPMQTFAEGSTGTARDKAAEQFGISGEQARKTLYVADHADLLDPADFADWDEGRLSTNRAFQRVKAAQERAEQERDEAKRDAATARAVGDRLRGDLADAYKEIEALEQQNDQLYERASEPQVVERTVEVAPSDYEAIRHERDVYFSDLQRLRQRNEEMRRELDRANGMLGIDKAIQDVRKDVQYLISATNQYVRQYGGLTWTAASFEQVDAATLDELHKAAINLATFANALVASLEKSNG